MIFINIMIFKHMLLKEFIKKILKEEYVEPTPGDNIMKSLEEKNFKFYGGYVEFSNPIRWFKLNDIVYQCGEEEVDYEYIVLDIVESSNYDSKMFSQTPLAIVKVLYVQDGLFKGWELVDVRDQHVWVRVGTHIEDYEAWVEFDYTPKYHDKNRFNSI